MAGNSIGQHFRVTTFGESHGLALGCIVDGCPPGLALTEADLQIDLDRRKPGTSKYTNWGRALVAVRDLLGVVWLCSRAAAPFPYEASDD